MKMKAFFICFFAVLFLAVAPTAHEPFGISAFENDSCPHFEPAYTPHAPIVISDDGDLAAFPGNGTAANPYRIEGYNITSDGVCIDIQDTTAHYLITDCLISAPGSSSSHGIRIISAPNGTIQECMVERHQAGLRMENSVDCSIVNNTFRDNSGNGFHCSGGGNILVKNNTAVDNGFGLRLIMENSIVQNNSLYNNSVGLYMGGVGVTVIENEAKNNSQYGFYLGLVSSNFTHNMAMENQVGIRINELELESRL
ncbi:right-handed parallel beta-helix repeat-containing protein, partial [Candidatus Thorarchaeota archaeon]